MRAGASAVKAGATALDDEQAHHVMLSWASAVVLSKSVRLQRDARSSREAPVVSGRRRVGSHKHKEDAHGQSERDALGDRVRSNKASGGARSSARTAIRRYLVPWTTGKTPRLGRTLSSTSTGPLLVAILSATARLRSGRCEISRPSHAGCSPRVAASRTSRPSSGSSAAPGATRYSRSGRRSSRWSASRFCACSLSSGPAPSDQPELPAVARVAARARA
jgi:hypothetical protein